MKKFNLCVNIVSVEHRKPKPKEYSLNIFDDIFECTTYFIKSFTSDMIEHKMYTYYEECHKVHNTDTLNWSGLNYLGYSCVFSNRAENLFIRLKVNTNYKHIPDYIEEQIDSNNIGDETVHYVMLFDGKQFCSRREFYNYIDEYIERIFENVETV